MKNLNISLCQINPVVGNFKYNLDKISDFILKAKNAHLIVFPELSLCGYMPYDMIYSSKFINLNKIYLEKLMDFSKDVDSLIVVGFVREESAIYNSLAVIYKGEVLGFYDKKFLPNYNVFDEKRYFKSGSGDLMIDINDVRTGFSICEDIWYPDGTEREDALNGAELIVNVNASPYSLNKQSFKETFLKARAMDNMCFIAYVNLAGANDELVFNGESIVIDPKGNIIAKAKAFEEDTLNVGIDINLSHIKRRTDMRWVELSHPKPSSVKIYLGKDNSYPTLINYKSVSKEEELISAIILSIKDYFYKQGFKKAILGLSGGIDSGIVLYLGSLALGKDNIKAIYMPTTFNKEESYTDAKALCDNLGVELKVIPIEEIRKVYEDIMGYQNFDVADENIQARIRANILFYISNKENMVVLSTSNKSESAVGYTTIYGDMAGGFAPIKDLYKTEIYELANFINKEKEIIPKNIIQKPPSAELRPNQKDQDLLPPYEILDKILWLLIEEYKDIEDIPFDKEITKKIYDMLLKAQYKRRQAPIGPKLHERAFGIGWRYPIVRGSDV